MELHILSGHLPGQPWWRRQGRRRFLPQAGKVLVLAPQTGAEDENFHSIVGWGHQIFYG